MKIRNGYISNSSSCSWIIMIDLTDKGICCLKLTQKQKELINGFNNIKLDVNKDYYLTQFIYDDNNKWKQISKIEHIEYVEGQMNGQPRDIDFYNEYSIDYDNSVYILKQHDEAKQMTFNQFVNLYKKSDLPKDIVVKYESDGIKLLYVW